MGFKLVDEVLDHAPAALTMPERFLLVLLAKAARDETRTCWPGMDTLARQMGVTPRRVRQVLNQVARRGYEVRVPAGIDSHGRPTFACRGRATVYRLPIFDPGKGEVPFPLSESERGNHSADFDDKKGGSFPSERGKLPVGKAVGVLPPSFQEPSGTLKHPRTSDPNRNGGSQPLWLNEAVCTVAKELAAVKPHKTYDPRDLAESITSFLRGRTVTSPLAFIRKCATDNPLQFEPTPGPPRYHHDQEKRPNDHRDDPHRLPASAGRDADRVG